MTDKPRRRGLRFSLRTLLVVVTLLSCYLAWETSAVRQRLAVRKSLQGNAAFYFPPAGKSLPAIVFGTSPRPATVSLVRRWLGDEAIQEIWYTRHYQGFSEEELSRLERIFPEANFHDVSLAEPCHPGCFPSGTLVDTPDGPRAIENIRPGDAVTAWLPGGEAVPVAAESVFVTDNRLWSVETDAGMLRTTETQPLCRGLDHVVPAGELQPGDTILRLQDGEIHHATVLRVAATGRTERVFNLVLGGSECFAANGFLARSKPPAE